jgi:hypothetical protein
MWWPPPAHTSRYAIYHDFNIDNPKSMCFAASFPPQGLFLTARGFLSVCRTATSRLVNNLAMNAGSAVTTATTTLQSYVTFLK